MKVFISYGAAADQVTALRLQALGAVNGLTVHVPPAYTRQRAAAVLDAEAVQELNQAGVILAVVGAGLTDACRQELEMGIALRKHMIVMSYPQWEALLRPCSCQRLFETNSTGVEQ